MGKKNLIIQVKKDGLKISYFSNSTYSNFFLSIKEKTSFLNLPDAFKKNKIPNIPCHIVLNEDNDYILYLVREFPAFPEEQLRKVIEFETKRYFNTDVFFDYKIVGKITEGSNQSFLVLFVFTPKDILNELIEKFRQVRIKPISITFSFDATSLIFRKILPQNETYLIVNFDQYCTNFLFLKGNDILYARREFIGSDNFDTILAKEMEISKEKAKELNESGLPFLPDRKEFFYIRPVLEQFLKEINNSIEFFQTFWPKEIIKKIYFIGTGMMKMKGLLENIQKKFSISCEMPIFETEAGLLPLDAMDIYGLNLYTPIFNFLQQKVKLKVNKKLLITLGIIILYIFSLHYVDRYFWKKFNNINRPISFIPQYEKILQQKVILPELLLALGTIIPDDVVLTNVIFEKEKVRISGNSIEEKSLSDFYLSLLKTEFFKDLEVEKDISPENISFTIKGTLKE